MLHKEWRILSELDNFQLEKRLCRQHVYFISSFVNWKYSNCDFCVTETGGLIEKYNKENSVKNVLRNGKLIKLLKIRLNE